MVDLELSQAHEQLRASARELAASDLRPRASAREAAHAIEPAVIAELGRRGLLGVNVPRALGGSEHGPVAYAAAVREIARGDAAVAVTMAVTNMVAEVITRFGTPAQRARHVPPLVSGQVLGGAFGLTEPQAGSDAGALACRAVKDGGGWRLNGQKQWISTGDAAGVTVIWARTGGPGVQGISCFLVEPGTPGFSWGKPEDKMGLRASHTVALALDDVRVPETALLGAEGQGFPIAMMALDGGRIGISAQSHGIGSAALELARDHLRGAAAAGSALALALEPKLADMATELDAAWLLTLRAASLKERHQPFSVEAAMAKVFASEAADRAARETVQILGPRGLLEESGAPRLVRDCRVTRIYEGTSEIQRLVVGRAVLKQNRGLS